MKKALFLSPITATLIAFFAVAPQGQAQALKSGTAVTAARPDCATAGAWAPTMAQVQLMNESSAVRQQFYNAVDHAQTRVTRLASEKTGQWPQGMQGEKNTPDNELHRQIHRVEWFFKDGSPFMQVITVNDASMEECSMSAVQVYVVSRRLE